MKYTMRMKRIYWKTETATYVVCSKCIHVLSYDIRKSLWWKILKDGRKNEKEAKEKSFSL